VQNAIQIEVAKEGTDDFCAILTVNVFLVGYKRNSQLFFPPNLSVLIQVATLKYPPLPLEGQ